MRRRSVECWLVTAYVVSLLVLVAVVAPPARASGRGYYVVTSSSQHRAPRAVTVWTGAFCHAVWVKETYHDFGVDLYAIKVWGNWCTNGTGGLVKWQWARDFAVYDGLWSWCGWQTQIRQSGNITGSSGWASEYVKGCMYSAVGLVHAYPSLKMTVYGSGKYTYSGKAY